MALHNPAYLLSESGDYRYKVFAPYVDGKPVNVIVMGRRTFVLDLRKNPQVLDCASPVPFDEKLRDHLCYYECTRAFIPE